MSTPTETIRQAELMRRFIDVELVENGPRYVVGAGDSRTGARGTLIAVVRLRHAGGYELILQLDNGKLDSFSSMQLYPELPH
ncbi:hypothetical protein [Burkholderia cenocepacia]|uniref:hypothetical protein n=1 Tax=Burkholderia cepacia complex TaxID=87882 RepID=UPI00196B960D|nr:hypothetical protein [Burkholderia cenocepacia]MBN3507183.1 hypothetical protein [Burkholderia cenocepacia]